MKFLGTPIILPVMIIKGYEEEKKNEKHEFE